MSYKCKLKGNLIPARQTKGYKQDKCPISGCLLGAEVSSGEGSNCHRSICQIHQIIETARDIQKYISASLTTLNLLSVWITTNCGKFLNFQTILPVCRSRSNRQNRSRNNGLVQNLERGMSSLHIVRVYLMSMHSTSFEM